jgi:hypothetical protein
VLQHGVRHHRLLASVHNQVHGHNEMHGTERRIVPKYADRQQWVASVRRAALVSSICITGLESWLVLIFRIYLEFEGYSSIFPLSVCTSAKVLPLPKGSTAEAAEEIAAQIASISSWATLPAYTFRMRTAEQPRFEGGLLTLHLHSACRLECTASFISVSLASQACRTRTITGTQNPVWKETKTFRVHNVERDVLIITALSAANRKQGTGTYLLLGQSMVHVKSLRTLVGGELNAVLPLRGGAGNERATCMVSLKLSVDAEDEWNRQFTLHSSVDLGASGSADQFRSSPTAEDARVSVSI